MLNHTERSEPQEGAGGVLAVYQNLASVCIIVPWLVIFLLNYCALSRSILHSRYLGSLCWCHHKITCSSCGI